MCMQTVLDWTAVKSVYTWAMQLYRGTLKRLGLVPYLSNQNSEASTILTSDLYLVGEFPRTEAAVKVEAFDCVLNLVQWLCT